MRPEIARGGLSQPEEQEGWAGLRAVWLRRSCGQLWQAGCCGASRLILQATALAKQRQQAAALAPIKYAYLALPMNLYLACSCQSVNCN